MQLIDDIEEQVAINGESFRGPLLREAWPRIKAALLAGEELSECLLIIEALGVPMPSKVGIERERFRAATEGT